MTDARAPGARLLDDRGAVALVVANTIGTGVFTTSGFALADLGSPDLVLLAWLLGGFYALAGVAIYADLAIRFPRSGGEYEFLRQTLHPALGTVAGWISLVAGFSSPIAAAALGAQLYAARAFSLDLALPWIATALTLVLGLLHAFAPRAGVRFQNAAVLIKIVAILIFIGFGAAHIGGGAFPEAPSEGAPFSFLALGGALVWITYAYSGWNAAVYVTGEVEGGGVAVRRALYSGTLLVTALYLGVSAVILFSAPPSALSGVAESGAVAARAFGGPWAEQALSSLIALALLTSASSMLVSGPRVYAQMARDGALPAVFGRLQGEDPRMAVLAQTAICLVIISSAGLRSLLEFAGVSLSLSAGAVVVGWLRQEFSQRSRPRPLLLAAAVLFLVATMGIAFAGVVLRPLSVASAILLICFGLAAHYGAATRKPKARPARDP